MVYVNTVAQLTGISQGNGLQNRFAGVVESKNTWKVEKNAEKTVKEVYVEVGQEVQQGTPLFSYDTDQFQANLEQARLDLERGQNEISSMRDSISQLEKEKKSAPKDQQASLTLEIQQAELDLKKRNMRSRASSLRLKGWKATSSTPQWSVRLQVLYRRSIQGNLRLITEELPTIRLLQFWKPERSR